MKKILSILFTITLISTLAFVFFSCNNSVLFNVNFMVDGEVYNTVSTEGKETITIPENPTKEGYTFDGWYWDNETWQTPFTANSLLDAPLSSDMSVYAKWKQNVHIHTPVTDAGVLQTDTEDGLTEGSHCSECGEVIVAQQVIPANLQGTDMKSTLLTVGDETLTTSFPNNTETFSFLKDIVVAKNAEYIVARDIFCESVISSKTVPLEPGDNTYYILITNGSQQKLYTVTIRRLPMYTVTFNSNGGTSVVSQTVEEGSLATEPTTSRIGYTFSSWSYDFNKPIMANTNINARWTPNTNTPYKVEYYLENLTKDGYDLVHTDSLTGTTASYVTAEIKDYEHFTYNSYYSDVSGNIAANGSLVLRVAYRRNSYTVNTSISSNLAGSVSNNGTFPYGTEITVTATANIGYTFNGWFNGTNKVSENLTYKFNVSENLNLVANITANTNTPYKVEYYLENLTKDGYELHLTDNLTGTTDTTAEAAIKTFDHFTYDSNNTSNVLSGNIDGNGTLVLKVYYTRNSYTVNTSVSSNLAGNASNGGTFPYGTEITVTASANPGYTFNGWFNGTNRVSENLTYKFNVSENLNLVANITANTNTPYKVEYYLENLTKDGYELHLTDNLTGTTDTTAEAAIKTFEHFTYDSNNTGNVLSGNIDGNGTLVLKVYYTRNSYTVSTSISSNLAGNVSNGGTFPYGTEITVTATANLGYTFTGWYINDELVSENYTYTCVIEASIVAKFEVATEMENFTFTSTETTCTITGVKDNTVTEIIIPDYVTSIGSGSFEDCSKLTSITVPNSVTSIGSSAFSGCSSLESITLPFVGSSKSATSASKSTLFGYIFGKSSYTGGTSTKQYYSSYYYATYYIPTSLKNVTITGGNILYGAFYNCSNLISVTIGDGVTSVGEDAFSGCSSLTSVTIPNSVTSIGTSAFWGCYKLFEVINHSSLSISKGSSNYGYIAEYALEVHRGESKIVNKDNYLFYTYNGTNYLIAYVGNDIELLLPQNYNSEDYAICEKAFDSCSSLTSVTIPNGVTSIGNCAFEGCSSLTTVTIPNGVTSIGNGAFEGCSKLTNITIPNSVTSIGFSAFSGCYNLTSITIPNSVTSIGYYAFYECSSLTSVTFENTTGWKAGSTSISSSSLEDKSTAAEYLRNTYYDYTWTRSE